MINKKKREEEERGQKKVFKLIKKGKKDEQGKEKSV